MHDWQRLQPLRIPSGWTMMINKLEDMESEELLSEDKTWLFAYTEDILYMYTNMSRKKNKELEKQTLAIDLGWYPDGDPNGTFCLLAVLNDNWENPCLNFLREARKKLSRCWKNGCLMSLCRGIILKKRFFEEIILCENKRFLHKIIIKKN